MFALCHVKLVASFTVLIANTSASTSSKRATDRLGWIQRFKAMNNILNLLWMASATSNFCGNLEIGTSFYRVMINTFSSSLLHFIRCSCSNVFTSVLFINVKIFVSKSLFAWLWSFNELTFSCSLWHSSGWIISILSSLNVIWWRWLRILYCWWASWVIFSRRRTCGERGSVGGRTGLYIV